MTTGLLTNTRGRVVPLQNTMKRTKTLDLSSYFALAAGAASISNVVLTGYAYSDSAGSWWLTFVGGCSIATPTGTVSFTLSLGTNFTAGTNAAQAFTAWNTMTGNTTTYLAVTGSGSNLLTVWLNASPATLGISGTLKLVGEPTVITTAANMETAGDVTAYIPDATAAVSGLVNTGTQTIGGVKTFSSNPKVTALDFSPNTATSSTGITSTGQLLTWYEEGTFVSTAGSGTGWTAGGPFTIYWTKVGKMVTLVFPNCYGTTTDASRSNLTFNTNLPSALSPAIGVYVPVRNYYGAGSLNTPSQLVIGTGGNIIIYEDLISTGTWASGMNCGMWGTTVCYRTA